ncbi:putative methyltransferase PMT26 [Heracleum sosnowskyi]|uniref:Methyltransferase PMT26 n=1 Tax=Heracleum sosnowskyi TaxID=360622 RepID=A0AAD8MFR0_9APIA|nr:putative methyltransferase PMT26 [Heracleum sosnowskyi]
MAIGKYSRVDGRKSTNYCSTATIVVFVALCLVGVWMLMSSSVDPVQKTDLSSQDSNTDFSSQDSKADLKEKVTDKFSNQFEDSSGEQAEDATKEESKTTKSEDESNSEVNETETQETQEEKTVEESSGGNSNEEDSKKEGEGSDNEESNSGGQESNPSTETNENSQSESENEKTETESNPNEGGDKQETEEIVEEPKKKEDEKAKEEFPAGAQSEILKETTTESGSWSTQAAESESEKNSQKSKSSKDASDYKWKVCNVTAGPDYIPCLDNLQAISKLPHRDHYQHRERHCPDEAPTCLVSLPEGYRQSIKWPTSREQIWYYNVPHTKLAEVKGHQNWVKVTGDHLTFPGGGTQFIHGALHYIDFIQQALPDIAWGKRTRVILDVGCGVASLGGYLFERDVLALSFAPKDEHEAQVQFALERGIPAISAVMGTKRLPFPSKVFDIVHCARCRVPWHIEGGKLLLELNRVLRPGGYFVWSATPVYRNDTENADIWKAMSELTKSMCWDLVKISRDELNEVGAAIYRKPSSNECYEKRPQNEPPLCNKADEPDAVWNVQLQACIHKVPEKVAEHGSQWPELWPQRLEKVPSWLSGSAVGVYGKAAPEDFTTDNEHWKRVVSASYLTGLGIDWSSVRNVMDMKAVYGGFAAALKDLKVWVMNIVPITSADTLPIIYERGLFGMYHDWCESFSTYPRTYDLVHADHLFSDIKKRCKLQGIIAEVDRILRPKGTLIVRDDVETITEIEKMAKSLQWKVQLTYSKDNEGLLCVQKSLWRPTEVETISSAIA